MSDEELLSDDIDLDDISLSESDLAELEREFAEENEQSPEPQEEEIQEEPQEEEIKEEPQEEEIQEELQEEEEIEESEDEVDMNEEVTNESIEASLEEEDKIQNDSATSAEDDSPKSTQLSELEQQIEAELDDLAEGLTDLQFSVKLRMRLREEMIEGFHLQHTLEYIAKKIETLTQSDTKEGASQAEIDECNERISELKLLLEHEKEQNVKMHEAIQKLRTAHAKVIWDQQLAEKTLKEAENRRRNETKECSEEIRYQTEQFIECKKEQNQTIRLLNSAVEKLTQQRDLWKMRNDEIQGEIDALEANIQANLNKTENIMKEKEVASDDHALRVEKIKLKITRQQKQYEITKAENDRRHRDLEEQKEKLEKLKQDQQEKLEKTEQFKKEARKLERANARQKTQIQTLESDKEDAKRSLRDAERKLRLKGY